MLGLLLALCGAAGMIVFFLIIELIGWIRERS